MLIRRTVIPALVLALVVAGCANADQAGAPEPTAPGPSGAAPSDLIEEPSLPGKPSTSGQPAQSITGTVVAGVEANCLLLTGASGEHLLIIRDAALRAAAKPGSKITAVGTPDPGMMTTCQQGIPFTVISITPN